MLSSTSAASTWGSPAHTRISVWRLSCTPPSTTCSLAMLLPLSSTLLLSRYLLWPETALVSTYLSFSFIPVLSSTGDGSLFLEHFPSPFRSSVNTCWVIEWEYLSSSSSKLPSILRRTGQAAATLQHGERVALTPSCQNFQESWVAWWAP